MESAKTLGKERQSLERDRAGRGVMLTAQLGSPVFHAEDHSCDSVCDWGGGGGSRGRGSPGKHSPTQSQKVKYSISKLCSILKAFHFRQPEFQLQHFFIL